MDDIMVKMVLAIISLLLGVIGYFLKQLHGDFKTITRTIVDIDKRIAIHEERMRNDDKIVTMKIKELDTRIAVIEEKLR